MKKRLISLLVALCMAVTLLPVSAITAWAEGGGQLKIVNGYPEGSKDDSNGTYTISCSGDGWSYDGTTQTLTLNPLTPTTYDLTAYRNIRKDENSILCSAIIGENATIVNGNFWNVKNPGSSITNYGTITSGDYSMPVVNHGTIINGTFELAVSNESGGTIENGAFQAMVTNSGTINGGIFKDAVTNHGTIIGGRFFSSVTNELDGIIENGQFGIDFSPCTVTNNGGTINGGTFKEMSSIRSTGSVASGYTLAAETPSVFSSVSVNGYHNSCYIIPNQASVSVDISYRFDDTMYDLPPLDVTIDNAPPTLLSDWCGSDLKIEFEDIRGVYEVTFTAPLTNDADTVTIRPLTWLVIDKDGYPATAQDLNGNRANYTGEGWKFENNSLILEPTAEKSYDFNSTDLNPHRVAVNCPVTVNSNATITNGIFLKEVTGSALNGVFLNVPNGCENSTKKITVSDNGKITALKMSGEATALDSAANELYVVGQPTGTLYVTLSSGKVREVQLPLTADLELRLNDPAPKPEPEPETYTLKVVGGSFTTGERDALTSGTVPVDAEAKVTLDPDAVPEGMVFDQWTISEESLLGNPNVAYNAESFTIPANAVENGKTVTVEAQYREASIEDDGPGILETAAMIGVAGTGAAVLGYTGYMIGTELYLNTVLPAGAAIPNNAGELALLLWEAAGTPAPAALLPADAAPVQQALAWAIENQLLAPDASAEDSVSRWEVIRSWNQLKG